MKKMMIEDPLDIRFEFLSEILTTSHFISMGSIQLEQSEQISETDDQNSEATAILKEGLHFNCPTWDYAPCKVVMIPLDPKTSNNSRFNTLDEAMTYLKSHCMHHYGKFNKNFAQHYLPFCAVYNPYIDAYVYLSDVSKKEFDRAFKRCCFP